MPLAYVIRAWGRHTGSLNCRSTIERCGFTLTSGFRGLLAARSGGRRRGLRFTCVANILGVGGLFGTKRRARVGKDWLASEKHHRPTSKHTFVCGFTDGREDVGVCDAVLEERDDLAIDLSCVRPYLDSTGGDKYVGQYFYLDFRIDRLDRVRHLSCA